MTAIKQLEAAQLKYLRAKTLQAKKQAQSEIRYWLYRTEAITKFVETTKCNV